MRGASLVLVGDTDRRTQVKRSLSERSDVSLAGEVSHADALDHILDVAPDIVVLDCAAREVNGLMALQWLSALPGAPSVIALGLTGSPAERELLLELGADGYATLENPTTLANVLGAVVARNRTLKPSLA